MKRIRTGVIGVGNMGRHHARVYSQHHNIDLIGVYDVSKENRESVARGLKVEAFDSVDKLLEEADIVSIAVPTSLHFFYGMKAISSGKHILIEKPIASTIDQASALVKAARNKGVVLQVGHIERFNPAFQELKKILMGNIIEAIDIRRLSPFDGRINDADVVLDLMIHDLDIIQDLIGLDYKALNSLGRCVKSQEDVDYAVTSFQSKNNVIVTLTASRITEQKVREIAITTDSSYILTDLMERKITISRRTNLDYYQSNEHQTYRQENIIEKIFVPNAEPLQLELSHFVDCVLKGNKPMVDGEAGQRTLEMAIKVQDEIYGLILDKGIM